MCVARAGRVRVWRTSRAGRASAPRPQRMRATLACRVLRRASRRRSRRALSTALEFDGIVGREHPHLVGILAHQGAKAHLISDARLAVDLDDALEHVEQGRAASTIRRHLQPVEVGVTRVQAATRSCSAPRLRSALACGRAVGSARSRVASRSRSRTHSKPNHGSPLAWYTAHCGPCAKWAFA